MIRKEDLWRELKMAQLSLLGITNPDTEIEYTWEHVPEKLTPGHRQRTGEKITIYCLPYRVKINGKWRYSHWDGKNFINPIPHRSVLLDKFFIDLAKIFVSKKKRKGMWHYHAYEDEVIHDCLIFLYMRACRLDLNKIDNPAPYLLFCLGNYANTMSKNYFSCAEGEFNEKWMEKEF